VSALAWAGAFIAGKIVLAHFTPLAAASWRYAVATAVLAPFAWRARGTLALRPLLLPLCLMITCGGVLYPWLFLSALQRTSAANTSLLIALNPALTVLLSPLVGEVPDGRRVAGMLTALAGAAIVITNGDVTRLSGLGEHAVGDLLALVCAVLWATYNLASRLVVAHLPHALVNALTYGVGGIALFALSSPTDPYAQLATASTSAVFALVVMGAVSSALAGQFFLHGVRTVGVGRSVAFVYLVPVLTAVGARLALNEPLSAAQIVGGGIVLGGVALATRMKPWNAR
jgi:drug/metabolite transporter (DMT)-like permease